MDDRKLFEVTPEKGGARFAVHVAARASKTRVCGVHDGALKVRLAAAPVDGAANEALVASLAKFLGAPKSSVGIVGGWTSRRKVVRVSGMSAEEILKRIGDG